MLSFDIKDYTTKIISQTFHVCESLQELIYVKLNFGMHRNTHARNVYMLRLNVLYYSAMYKISYYLPIYSKA